MTKSNDMELSAFAKKVERWYDHGHGIWDERMVRDAVAKGKITQEECDYILAETD